MSAATLATKRIAQHGTRTNLPWLVLFLGTPSPNQPLPFPLHQLTILPGSAGTYTYMTAQKGGNAIDRARSRFLQAKDANDLRISGGAKIQHVNEMAARLPETYHGVGDLGLWSDKERFGIEKVERYEPWARQS